MDKTFFDNVGYVIGWDSPGVNRNAWSCSGQKLFDYKFYTEHMKRLIIMAAAMAIAFIAAAQPKERPGESHALRVGAGAWPAIPATKARRPGSGVSLVPAPEDSMPMTR